MWHEGFPGDTSERPQFFFDPNTIEFRPYTPDPVFTSLREVRETSGSERDSGEVPEEVSRMQVIDEEYPDYYQMDLDYRTRLAQGRDALLNPEEQEVYDDTLLDLEYGPGFRLRAHP